MRLGGWHTCCAPSALRRSAFGGLIEAVGLLWIYLAYSQLRAMATGSGTSHARECTPRNRVEQFFRMSSERTVRELALRVFDVFHLVVSNLLVRHGALHRPITVLVVL